MARAIDAEQYMELLKEQYLHNKFMNHGEAAKAWQGAMQLLCDMPTLTPQNESLTCEGCDMQGEKITPCESCIRDPRVCDYYTRRPPKRQVDTNV